MRAIISLLILLLTACSDGSQNTHSPTTSRVPDSNVFSEPVQALEKAEQVEQLMEDAHADRRGQLEQQIR